MLDVDEVTAKIIICNQNTPETHPRTVEVPHMLLTFTEFVKGELCLTWASMECRTQYVTVEGKVYLA